MLYQLSYLSVRAHLCSEADFTGQPRELQVAAIPPAAWAVWPVSPGENLPGRLVSRRLASTTGWLALIPLAGGGACRLPPPHSRPLSRPPPGLASWLTPREIPPPVLPRPVTGRAGELALALAYLPGAR